MPRFSIIIPVYNTGPVLELTIQSALEQTAADVEIIVVDDGSTDRSYETASRHPGICVTRQKNAGDAAARNTGLAMATGEFIVFLDHDDLLTPDALDTHYASFAAEPDIDMVFGSNVQISETGEYLRENLQAVRKFSGRDVGLNTTPSFSQCMYRRSALERIGGFQPAALNAADHDLNIRLLGVRQAGMCHGHMVMSYRKHLGQQTRSPSNLYINHMRVLDWHFGPGGILEDPDYLSRIKMRWKKYYGRAMPGEALRLLRQGKTMSAARVAKVFFQTLPQSGYSTLEHAWKKLVS